MKKLLLSLAIVASGAALANAAEITFEASNSGIAYTGEGDGPIQPLTQLSYQGVVVDFNNDNTTTKSAWYNPGASNGDWRTYASAVITVNAPSGQTITGIAFTFTSSWGSTNYSNLTVSTGAITPQFDADNKPANGATITWAGSASSVAFTVPATKDSWQSKNPQFRFAKMVVTTESSDPDVLEAPVISGKSEFYTPTSEVSISGVSGASIYYTLSYDGTPADPTTSSILYESPFEINNTATVKAIAVKDGKTSAVTTATFTKLAPTSVASIAEFLATSKSAVCQFTNPLTVVYLSGKYLFVKDATGGLQVYNSAAAFSQAYAPGQTITNVVGVHDVYNNNPQLAVADYAALLPEEGTGTASTQAPQVVTLAESTAESLYNCYVMIKDQTITLDGSYYYLGGTDKTQQLYNRFNAVDLSSLNLEKSYDIVGFPVIYGTTHEIFVTEVSETTSVKGIEDEQVAIYGTNGAIVAPAEAVVYNINGVRVNNDSLVAGIYLVRYNGKTVKVVVK